MATVERSYPSGHPGSPTQQQSRRRMTSVAILLAVGLSMGALAPSAPTPASAAPAACGTGTLEVTVRATASPSNGGVVTPPVVQGCVSTSPVATLLPLPYSFSADPAPGFVID